MTASPAPAAPPAAPPAPAAPPIASSASAATMAGRLMTSPSGEPASRLWFSDREIGARRSRVALAYTADDFRAELRRVERKLYCLSFAGIAVALAAVAAVIATVFAL